MKKKTKNRELNENMENTLNEQFPKGKCKERGNALVLFAEAQRELDELQEVLDIALSEIVKLRKKLGYDKKIKKRGFGRSYGY